MQQKLYNTIGRDHSQSVSKRAEGSENVLSLKSQQGGKEIIPEQKNLGSETAALSRLQRDDAEV